MFGKPIAVSLAAALLALGSPAFAQAPSGKVTVVTSFSKDVTDPIKKAFETAHPGVTLDIQNRNTNAGVKFLEETKANNQVDLFWASAPDAFEVLKAKSLLQKYAPKATGIPDNARRAFRSTTPTAPTSALPRPATASCGTSAT